MIVSIEELDFKGGETTLEVYDRARELGLDLCPPEVGLQLRLQYLNQARGELLIIAMKPISYLGGKPHIFYVERDQGGARGLSADFDAYCFGWPSGNRFVFVRPAE